MVYFIQCGNDGPIKIGKSIDPVRRLQILALSAPSKLRLLATIPGSRDEESRLHRQFAEDRLYGEWFHPSPALLALIASFQDSWNSLCRFEPRLLDLLKTAEAIKDDRAKPAFCANAIWYHGIMQDGTVLPHSLKWELTQLVGWEANTNLLNLRTSGAYGIAYNAIYDALPACRNCSCL